MKEDIQNPQVSEATLVNITLNFCKHRLENSQQDSVEHKAMEFYIKQLESHVPCPENEKFVKPNRGIRGRTVSAEVTDTMVFQKFVMTDENGQFKTRQDGSLMIETCGFENYPTYLQFVRGESVVYPKGSRFYNGITMENYTLLNCPQFNLSYRHSVRDY